MPRRLVISSFFSKVIGGLGDVIYSLFISKMTKMLFQVADQSSNIIRGN